MLTIFLKPKEADSRITLKVYIRTSDGDTLCVRVTKMSGYGNTNSRYLLCVTRRWGALFLILFYFYPPVVLFSLTGRLPTVWGGIMDFKSVKEYLAWLYYQYQIISCCAVLEPWEQSMFNTILLTIVAMVVYTAYVFIPIHIRLAWEFFSKICGYHSSISTWSLWNPEKRHDGFTFFTTCRPRGLRHLSPLTWSAPSLCTRVLPGVWARCPPCRFGPCSMVCVRW